MSRTLASYLDERHHTYCAAFNKPTEHRLFATMTNDLELKVWVEGGDEFILTPDDRLLPVQAETVNK